MSFEFNLSKPIKKAENPEVSKQENIFSEKEQSIIYTYFHDLGLSWEQLKDKKIMDLGAGLGKFASAVKKRGVDVISIDKNPKWSIDEGGEILKDIPYIEGDALKLPFPENSFDLIVARASIFSIVGSQEELEKLLSEVKRVLTIGGEFRFGPGGVGTNVALEHTEKEDPTFEKKFQEIKDNFKRAEIIQKETEVLMKRLDNTAEMHPYDNYRNRSPYGNYFVSIKKINKQA